LKLSAHLARLLQICAVGNHSLLIAGAAGAGKTTFVHAFCDAVGVKDHVSSPTYSLVNEYFSPEIGTIYHIDLYRVQDEEEARQAGIEDVLYSGAFCFVEWPEIARGILPEDSLHAYLVTDSDGKRTLKLYEQ
jgi:tRNA threonylcarbamoyladenosine biosynthesis protein TsaE